METNSFDLVALVRSLILGVGTGLITAAAVAWIGRKYAGRKAIGILAGLGVAAVVTVTLFFMWPELVVVPDLGNLSQAEAEILLRKKDMVAAPIPQQGAQTQAGRVVPNSQDPVAGIEVRRGSVVRFGISTGTPVAATPQTQESLQVKLEFFAPKDGGAAFCSKNAAGIYHLTVQGTASGLPSDYRLVLWARPVIPPSDVQGWYLQRPPNGINSIRPGGEWKGIIQAGNAGNPPKTGDIFELAITAVDSVTEARLFLRDGIVVEERLPGIASDEVSEVKIQIK